jgi:hypothetical protein
MKSGASFIASRTPSSPSLPTTTSDIRSQPNAIHLRYVGIVLDDKDLHTLLHLGDPPHKSFYAGPSVIGSQINQSWFTRYGSVPNS